MTTSIYLLLHTGELPVMTSDSSWSKTLDYQSLQELLLSKKIVVIIYIQHVHIHKVKYLNK